MATAPVISIYTENIVLKGRKVSSRFLKKTLSTAAHALDLEDVCISLIIIDDPGIKKINSKYRRKNRPTDVISFAYREDPFPGEPAGVEELGDIYISLDRAEDQALAAGVTIKEEMARLMIHGLLHLVGYDHEKSDKEARKMERKEELLLRTVMTD